MTSTGFEASSVWDLEDNLSSIAGLAGMELDNLILGRDDKLNALSRLRKKILAGIPQSTDAASASLVDPETAVIFSRAVSDSIAGAHAHLDELVKAAGEIAAHFAEVITDPQAYRQTKIDALKKLRKFCVALSERATSMDWPRWSEPDPQGFRR